MAWSIKPSMLLLVSSRMANLMLRDDVASAGWVTGAGRGLAGWELQLQHTAIKVSAIIIFCRRVLLSAIGFISNGLK
ncbi:MAG: hypothetical protein HC830_10525 [Bacteroidetes bacterium]|nr:hypothetical protein [Bacteroidota bacterium]